MPTPGDGEVLIRVYATTVNRTDCHILRGKPLIMRFITGLFKPRLFTRDSDRYDLVFDAVGKSSFGKCKSLLKKKGIYSSSGGPNFLCVFITSLPGGKREIFSPPKDLKGCLNFVKTLVEKGGFKPAIDRRYLLDQLAAAFEYVAGSQKTGNVIITIQSTT
jgi:NADPH:quinone reductase-like Zn-dependent oxidoreductase